MVNLGLLFIFKNPFNDNNNISGKVSGMAAGVGLLGAP